MEEYGGTSLVGTLFDTLMRPGAVTGVDILSPITWSLAPPIDHVVLGDGPPGGIWQVFSYFNTSISNSSENISFLHFVVQLCFILRKLLALK